ncbi:hypothetical protein [Tessaracoccus massiliensis]|uniref:hypothetical protein n=1 Tax=Tessaracoccus massiliensis TaxID=1522311 RepID=UPI0015D58AC3|nr:hypothetical protein [Tessaracoccus massiliensis]
MTESNEQLGQRQAEAQEQEVEGGASALLTIGLFVVMVVFTIGCMFFGWFQW